MDIEAIKKERENWLKWKNIAPIVEGIKKLPNRDFEINISDTIKIDANFTQEEMEFIKNLAVKMKPWRKGPFKIGELFIDSEWRSYIKYNLLKPHFNILGKDVGQMLGCNNGYYMFRNA